VRSYLIDEISPSDMEKIAGFLKSNSFSSKLDQLYWVKLSDDLLDENQFLHRDCQPHVFAVELGPNWVKLEFLIRSLKSMRCTCPGYASKRQMEFIIRFAHNMIEQLDIRT
jgi:hypothetical protein